MHILWYFYLYSLLGFLLEVAFAKSTRAPVQNRKCRLLLPLCPVYGLGVTGILLLRALFSVRGPWEIVLGALCATAVEYGTALFYERVWRVRFWDYRGLPGNLRGRVCLPFSLIWGMLTPPVLELLHPAVVLLTAALPDRLLLPLSLVFLLDTALTGSLLRRTRRTQALRWYA